METTFKEWLLLNEAEKKWSRELAKMLEEAGFVKVDSNGKEDKWKKNGITVTVSRNVSILPRKLFSTIMRDYERNVAERERLESKRKAS